MLWCFQSDECHGIKCCKIRSIINCKWSDWHLKRLLCWLIQLLRGHSHSTKNNAQNSREISPCPLLKYVWHYIMAHCQSILLLLLNMNRVVTANEKYQVNFTDLKLYSSNMFKILREQNSKFKKMFAHPLPFLYFISIRC